MVAASLVRDKESNLKEAKFRKAGKLMEYEFAFPYQNEDPGDSSWQPGKAYQIAVLVGPSEEFKGMTQDTWMSDQVSVRLGSPSQESIYNPPYLAQKGQPIDRPHGEEHGPGGKEK